MDKEQCDKMNQRITDMGSDIHGHIRNLSNKFDDHHTLLLAHLDRFENHEKSEIARHNQFIESQSLNTKAINDLTNSVSGVVEVYTTTHAVGKFIKWSSGIVLALAALWAWFNR